MSKRIYIIQSKTGKKKVFINAASKSIAHRLIMEDYFTTHIATHEELFEAFKDPKTEIVDAEAMAVQDDGGITVEETPNV
jgi:hypothetical protein